MSPHRLIGFARSLVTHRAGLGIAVLLSISCPVPVAGSCPQDIITVDGENVTLRSSTPTGSIQFINSSYVIVPWDAGQSCTKACYDLPKGKVVLRGYPYIASGVGYTSVRVADDYIVIGPAGLPLSFEAVLQVNATIEIEGTATARLEIPGSPLQQIQLTTTGFKELALPVVVAPGTSFQVATFASGIGGYRDGTVLTEVVIRFRGLPPEYAISSCQGYNLQTPARPVTWGAVKAHYR